MRCELRHEKAIENEIYKLCAPSNGYLSSIFLILFVASFLIYLERDQLALLSLALAFFVVPFLLLTDKFVFDGNKIRRTGIFPKIWAFLNSKRTALRLEEINKVETVALRVFRSGSKVFYRYRTMVRGEKAEFVLLSTNKSYRKFIKALALKLPEEALDLKTIEIKHFLVNPKRLELESERLGLPSDEFLEELIDKILREKNHRKNCSNLYPVTVEPEKIDRLCKIGNQLKLSGHLLRALECFRRSLFLNPSDAGLIFDYARCLFSFADSEKNSKLKRRAIAALKLAEMHAKKDKRLLSLIAESYYLFGDLKNARKTFQKVLDLSVDGDFRSACGLAEIALREGKLKQAVHYFSMASYFTQHKSLKKWAESEAKYFSRLDTDYDYAEKEIARMNWLKNVLVAKKISLKTALLGFAAILIGILTDDWLIDFGWAVSTLSLLCWLGFNASNSFLMERTP